MPAISAAEELHRLEWRVQALEEDYAHLGYHEVKKTYLLTSHRVLYRVTMSMSWKTRETIPMPQVHHIFCARQR